MGPKARLTTECVQSEVLLTAAELASCGFSQPVVHLKGLCELMLATVHRSTCARQHGALRLLAAVAAGSGLCRVVGDPGFADGLEGVLTHPHCPRVRAAANMALRTLLLPPRRAEVTAGATVRAAVVVKAFGGIWRLAAMLGRMLTLVATAEELRTVVTNVLHLCSLRFSEVLARSGALGGRRTTVGEGIATALSKSGAFDSLARGLQLLLTDRTAPVDPVLVLDVARAMQLIREATVRRGSRGVQLPSKLLMAGLASSLEPTAGRDMCDAAARGVMKVMGYCDSHDAASAAQTCCPGLTTLLRCRDQWAWGTALSVLMRLVRIGGEGALRYAHEAGCAAALVPRLARLPDESMPDGMLFLRLTLNAVPSARAQLLSVGLLAAMERLLRQQKKGCAYGDEMEALLRCVGAIKAARRDRAQWERLEAVARASEDDGRPRSSSGRQRRCEDDRNAGDRPRSGRTGLRLSTSTSPVRGGLRRTSSQPLLCERPTKVEAMRISLRKLEGEESV